MPSLVGRVRLAIPALGLCFFLVCGRCEAAPPDPLPAILTAQEWEFTDLGGIGHKVDLHERDEGGVLVFFFDLQSSDSLLGLNFFDQLFNRAADFGLFVIGVEATGRSVAEVRSLLQGYITVYKTPSFPVTADPDFSAAKLFGSDHAPTALLIGERGAIIARRSGFDFGTAVEMTRTVERLLHRSEGFFSPTLREMGLSELRERQLSARAEAPDAGDQAGTDALAWGDRLPAFEFTDTAGRVGRWSWRSGAALRVAFFWGGSSPGSADDLAFFQGLHPRGGAKSIEIIAIESTGLGNGLVNEILTDFNRKQPAPSFPVVPDPQGRLVRLFGAGNPLPQTFLIGGEGEILYRADGLDTRARLVLEEKIGRAVRLSGLGLQQAVPEVPDALAPVVGDAEAPSISRRLERDESLRFNLSKGDYFFLNGQHERAVLHYQRYLELDPASLHALVRLAQIYDILQEPAKAREFWERVLEISPKHAEGRARLNELRRTGVP